MSHHSDFNLRHSTLTPAFAYVDTKTCRSVFLASQAWASYWSKSIPAAHLSRPAPWHSFSPSELRDTYVRYAATHRQWESWSPIFKPALRLPPSGGLRHYWRSIRGTRWAWLLHHSTGEVSFCDLRAGFVLGKWSARGPVVGALVESRAHNECTFCHWKTNHTDYIPEYVPVLKYMS